MAKMKQQNQAFSNNNSKILKVAEREAEMERKMDENSDGIGTNYECIVCKSRDRQHSMALIAFAINSRLGFQTLNNDSKAFDDSKYVESDKIPYHLRGINLNFCGHCVHYECYSKYIKQLNDKSLNGEYYFGQGTISIPDGEYSCPYCKTISNTLVPLSFANKLKRNNINNNITDIICDEFKINNMDNKLEIDDIKKLNDDGRDIYSSLSSGFARDILRTEIGWETSVFIEKAIKIMEDWKALSPSKRSIKTIIMACNSLSYSISTLIINFNSYDAKQRNDRLKRSIKIYNTYIGGIWLFVQSLLSVDNDNVRHEMISNFSYKYIQERMLLPKSDDIKLNNTDANNCDPFGLFLRTVMANSSTFMIDNTVETKSDDAKVDTATDETKANDASENKNDEDLEPNTPQVMTGNRAAINTLYYSCYIMEIIQNSLIYIGELNDYNIDNIRQIISTKLNEDNQYKIYLNKMMLNFLKKSMIVYNSIYKIENFSSNLLWNDKDNICDELCTYLNIKTIDECLKIFINKTSDNDINKFILKNFNNYLTNINIDYIKINTITKHNINNDKLLQFKLTKLPQRYSDIFLESSSMTCANNVKPKVSVLCLICGKWVGLGALSKKINKQHIGLLREHSFYCNDGLCAFLWLQKCGVIFVYNFIASLWNNSIYLDINGEENFDLKHKKHLYLNIERYNQIKQLLLSHKILDKCVQLRKKQNDVLEFDPRLMPL